MAICWGRIPLWDVGGTCFSLLPREQIGKLRPESAQSLHSEQPEKQGWGKGLGFRLGRYGGPLSQKIHKFVSLVGTHCPLSVYILLNSCPREILPRGTLRFPRKVASGSNQGGAPGS